MKTFALCADRKLSKYTQKEAKMIMKICEESCTYEENLSGSRSQRVEDIVETVYDKAKKVGLSKLVDITKTDEIQIPVYSAEMEGSKIHNNYGKGVKNEQAKVSALMEFIERVSSERHQLSEVWGKYSEMVNEYSCEIVKSSSLITKYAEYVADSLYMNWSPILNLSKMCLSLIPTIAVLFPYYKDKTPIFDNNTNGIASGSTFHEAILQGVYEVIERDVISIGLATGEMKTVEIQTIKDITILNLIEEFQKNEVNVYIKYIENEFDLPCFIAMGVDSNSKIKNKIYGGYGCHSNKSVALIRALTELAQSRKSLRYTGSDDKIKGTKTEGYENNSEDDYLHSKDAEVISFIEIADFRFEDLNLELEYIINLLLDRKMEIYVANLTNEEIEVPVVRVVIPKLENWYDTRDRIGSRLYERVRKRSKS